MHGLRTAVFAHLQRQSLGFFTRTRGGEVQSRLTNDIGGMQSRGHLDRDLDRLQRHHRGRHGGRHGRAELAARRCSPCVVLPPADLADPPGRPDAPHRSPPQRQRRLADLHVQVEEGLSVSGVLLGKTLGAGPAPVRAVRRDLAPTWSASRSAPSWPAAGGWPR